MATSKKSKSAPRRNSGGATRFINSTLPAFAEKEKETAEELRARLKRENSRFGGWD